MPNTLSVNKGIGTVYTIHFIYYTAMPFKFFNKVPIFKQTNLLLSSVLFFRNK